MEAKELIHKLKVLLGMETEKAQAPEASTEPTNEKTEQPVEQPAEQPVEQPAAVETTPTEPAEAPTETTETALEAEQPATPAEPEANPLEKRINDLESKIDDLYGVIQALVEKQAVEAKEVPPTTTATPAQFAAQEEVKPLTRADKILALKNN